MDGINGIDRIVFRPSLLLRILFGVCGVLSFGAALYSLYFVESSNPVAILVRRLLLLLPLFASVHVNLQQISVTGEGIESRRWFGKRVVKWGNVKRIDQGRGSFVIETAAGPISAGWISPAEREELLRLVVERAKLTRVMEPSRFGLVAQYVPRAQDIGFVPHAKRREMRKDGDGSQTAEKQIPHDKTVRNDD